MRSMLSNNLHGDYRICPACYGARTQYSNKSGIREECSMCEGEGKILKKEAQRRIVGEGMLDER